ncbi:MAG: ATP-binding cassette domain-containing protein [Anaerolineae bacterium]
MLKGNNLSFRYGGDKPWILQGISLEVAPGEVVGLSGPSGLGKTTLAKILAGYLPPHTGQVTVVGQPLPLNGYCPIQLIFQHPELAMNPRWRIRQILSEGHFPSPELMASLSLEAGWLNRWPHELSGGELQRVAVARALGPRTRYLIADEMTAMLDANTQAQIWQAVMAHARQRQLGVLVISHDAPLLERLCQRVASMAELHVAFAT